MPYPLHFILSAVAAESSRTHVSDDDRLSIPSFILEDTVLSACMHNTLLTSRVSFICLRINGISFNIIENVSARTGITLPRTYIMRSVVIISLTETNHKMTDIKTADILIPYNTDSSVNGFPSGKYPSTVSPSCENNGLITAVTRINGINVNIPFFIL